MPWFLLEKTVVLSVNFKTIELIQYLHRHFFSYEIKLKKSSIFMVIQIPNLKKYDSDV